MWLGDSVHNLHISHNAHDLSPKILYKHCFNFSWNSCNAQGKWNTKVMQNFGGQMTYIMGDVQVAHICSVVLWCFE